MAEHPGETATRRAARVALIAAVVLVPLSKTVELPILGPRLTAFEFAAATAIVLWAFSARQRMGVEMLRIPYGGTPALAVFLVAAALSGVNAARLLDSRNAVAQYALELSTFVYLTALFYAGRDLLSQPQALRTALQAWAVAALLVVLGGLIGLAEMVDCARPLSPLVLWDARLVSTFRNPNQTAAYLVPTLAFLACLWSLGGLPRRWGAPVLLLYLAGLAVLVFTGSRGGTVAITVVLLAILLVMRFSRRAAVVVLSSAAIAVSSAGMTDRLASQGNGCLLYVSQTLASISVRLPSTVQLAFSILDDVSPTDRGSRVLADVSPEEKGFEVPADMPRVPREVFGPVPFGSDSGSSIAFRVVLVVYAWRLALEHPILGVGAGTMAFHVLRRTSGQAFVSAHNTFFTLLAEIGFVGAIAFGWFFGALSWSAWRLWHSAPSTYARTVNISLLVALAGILVMALSFDAQRQRVLWMIATFIGAAAPRWEGREAQSGAEGAGPR